MWESFAKQREATCISTTRHSARADAIEIATQTISATTTTTTMTKSLTKNVIEVYQTMLQPLHQQSLPVSHVNVNNVDTT
jgi:hypothetical protein